MVITLLLLFWVLVVPLFAFRDSNGKKTEYLNVVNKMIGMVLLIIKTVLYMPVMDILLRTINSTYHSVESLTVAQLGARYAITGFVLVLFPMLILYIERIFNIRVPTRAESIPWCAPFSRLTYIDLLVKLILILSNSLDTQG